MAKPKRDPKHRLSLVLTPTARERVGRLLVLSDADSMSEVIRRALALYEIMLTAQRDKNDIVLRTDDGEKLLLLA